MTTPATITLTDDTGVVLGHARRDDVRTGVRWVPACDLCAGPDLRPVKWLSSAVIVLEAHLESAHKEAA